MSDAELNELAAEVTPEPESDPTKNGSQSAATAAMPQEPADFLVLVCVQAVTVVGRLVTRRAKVSDLTTEEAQEVGRAVATVAAQYDLSQLSPRAAAWLGLGIAVGSVALPRIEEASKTIEGEPEPDTDAGAGEGAPSWSPLDAAGESADAGEHRGVDGWPERQAES